MLLSLFIRHPKKAKIQKFNIDKYFSENKILHFLTFRVFTNKYKKKTRFPIFLLTFDPISPVHCHRR